MRLPGKAKAENAEKTSDDRPAPPHEAAHTDPRWYWLDSSGLAWVRENLPDARVVRHRRIMFEHRGVHELRNEEAIVFPRGGLAKARKAGLKPRESRVETACGVCQRRYVPHFQDDPCIAGLPGVTYACCGHGEKFGGYNLFQNGLRVAFSGPDAIARCIDKMGDYRAVGPDDSRFWKGGHQ